MANGSENLKPFRSVEEARENGRKGGINSGIKRREKKGIGGTTKEMLYKPVTDPAQLKVIERSGMPVPKKPLFVHFLVASALASAIKKGSVDSLLKFMQVIGETPDTAMASDTREEDALSRSLRELAEEMNNGQ